MLKRTVGSLRMTIDEKDLNQIKDIANRLYKSVSGSPNRDVVMFAALEYFVRSKGIDPSFKVDFNPEVLDEGPEWE